MKAENPTKKRTQCF